MSDSKPCPALEWIDSDRIHGLREACATCPNRAPSAVEEELRECLELFVKWDTKNPWAKDGITLIELRKKINALLAKKGSEG